MGDKQRVHASLAVATCGAEPRAFKLESPWALAVLRGVASSVWQQRERNKSACLCRLCTAACCSSCCCCRVRRHRLLSEPRVRAGNPAVHSRDPSMQFTSATLGAHGMGGGCAAACGAVWMPPAVIRSRCYVLLLLSGRRVHGVQNKNRSHSGNHTRGQKYTAGSPARGSMGGTGCARRERRLSCCLVLCGWLPPCYCCTCVLLLLLLLLPVTDDSLCCCSNNFCALCSAHAFLR